MASRHLFVALSPHGYGHAAMTLPVLDALRTRIPDLRLTIGTRVPREWIAARIGEAFDLVDSGRDFGMVMGSATEVRVEESADAYARLHRDWDGEVDGEARRLARAAPDLLLANIPYTTLAGAARAGIPSVALCSLNWAGIYRRYCGHRPEAPAVLAQMEAAYNGARLFLRPTPAMPMEGLSRPRDIGPLARLGRDRRDELRELLGVGEGQRLGLLAFGGLDGDLDLEAWPVHPGWLWVSGQSRPAERSDVVAAASLPLPFPDLLRSCDLILSKPGYGTFVEAGCAGIPLIYSRRDDWPEEPHLGDWLRRHTRAAAVGPERMRRGDIGEVLDRLWEMPAPKPAVPSGIDEAADILAEFLA